MKKGGCDCRTAREKELDDKAINKAINFHFNSIMDHFPPMKIEHIINDRGFWDTKLGTVILFLSLMFSMFGFTFFLFVLTNRG